MLSIKFLKELNRCIKSSFVMLSLNIKSDFHPTKLSLYLNIFSVIDFSSLGSHKQSSSGNCFFRNSSSSLLIRLLDSYMYSNSSISTGSRMVSSIVEPGI